MKSAVAELIGAFLEAGGEIKQCPPGIGLGEPVFKAKKVIGLARREQQARFRICDLVVAALSLSQEPMTLLGIEKATGVPFDNLRGAVDALALDGRITVRQAAARQTRWFSITAANTGTGTLAGGPASVTSAAGACAGLHASPAARPGKAAAA